MKLEDYNNKAQTEEGRKEIVRALKGLKRSKGWQIALVYLKSTKDSLQRSINDIDNDVAEKDLLKKRIQLHYVNRILSLPEELAQSLSKTEDSDEVDGDIYE